MAYLLNVSGQPWVVRLEKMSRRECENLISWMMQAGDTREDYRICDYSTDFQCFMETNSLGGRTGNAINPHIGPYTKEAWVAFWVTLNGKGA